MTNLYSYLSDSLVKQTVSLISKSNFLRFNALLINTFLLIYYL